MNYGHKQSRREIIKTLTLLTASSALLGRKWVATVLAQVNPSATIGGVMKLKISDYPALQQVNGSVRIGTSLLQGPSNCLLPRGLFPPILINRGPNDQFYALESACTHAGCTVPVYDEGLGFSQCPHEGSRFAIDGGLLRGPAGFPLRSFLTNFDGADTLTVENQDWNFDLTTEGVVTGNPARLALRFITFQFLEYQVHFRATLEDDWTIVPFASTPSGPADQTVFVHPDFGGPVTVYVDRTSSAGFYSAAMRTREV